MGRVSSQGTVKLTRKKINWLRTYAWKISHHVQCNSWADKELSYEQKRWNICKSLDSFKWWETIYSIRKHQKLLSFKKSLCCTERVRSDLQIPEKVQQSCIWLYTSDWKLALIHTTTLAGGASLPNNWDINGLHWIYAYDISLNAYIVRQLCFMKCYRFVGA